MSYVIADPELMTSAAADLAAIGSNVNAAHMTAAVPTVAVLPAAADEVSTSIAHLFSDYGQEYQKLAGEVAASYEQFAQNLTSSAAAYASAEDVIAGFLQDFPNWANILASPATSPILPLLFLLLILILFAIIITVSLAIAIPLLGVGLPLVIAVALPLSIVGLAAFFGPIIVGALLLQLGAAL